MSRKRVTTPEIPPAPNPSRGRHAVFIPLGVLADHSLTPTEKLCLGFLNYCSANRNRCDVFRKSIALALGIDLKTASRTVAELESAGFIRTRRNGPDRPNTYFLLSHPTIETTREQGEKEHEWLKRKSAVKPMLSPTRELHSRPLDQLGTEEAKTEYQYHGTEETFSPHQPGTEGTKAEHQDGYRRGNLSGTEGTNSPHAEGTICPLPIRNTRSSLQEVSTRSRQAGETGELVENPEASKCDTEENPPACPPTSSEIAAEQGEDLPSDQHRVFEAVFAEKGIVTRDLKHVTEIIEAARRAACPTELAVEFVRQMAEKKSIETSTLVRDVVVEHLSAWMCRAEGTAAAAAIEAASRPVVRPDCSACGETGIRKSTPSSWCHCAIGELRRQRDEVVFVKGEECINCAATLRWHTRVNPEKVLCFFCSRPEQNGSRAVTEFEIATARTQLQARVAIPKCKRCRETGAVTRDALRENEFTEFCECGWGVRLRKLKGEGWAEAETRRARDLWQRLNAACPGKRAEVKSETRPTYLANGQPAGER